MKLSTDCNNCHRPIRVYTWQPDRINLEMEKGKLIELKCRKCGHIDKYHLNELIARENKFALIIGLLIFVIGTPLTICFVWDYLFQTSNIYSILVFIGLITVPFTVYAIIEKEQRRKVRDFNSFRISE